MALKKEYDWLFIMTATKNTSTRSYLMTDIKNSSTRDYRKKFAEDIINWPYSPTKINMW